MGKSNRKRILKYGKTRLPENLGEILANADEGDLKILIALMMAADENGEISEDFSVASVLELEQSEVDAAVKFWRGAGVISGAAKTTKPAEAVRPINATPSEDRVHTTETAHRNGAVEKSTGVSSYGTAELASLLEKRKGLAEFINEAQRVFGKTFNSYDTSIIVGLVDQLGFEEAAVLAILSYVTRMGKKGVRYTEKVALAFYDDGYTHTKEVEEHIRVIENSREVIEQIKRMFGIDGRELSRTEKTLFEKWTQKLRYDIEVIRKAYDITVDKKQKAIPKYTDAILESWYHAGLKTLVDIEEYEKSQQGGDGSGDGDTGKSYDLDDFFDAALRRSLQDLK